MKQAAAIAAVRRYLSDHFRDHEITDANDFDRHAHSFRITTANKVYLLTVADEFLDDTPAASIASALARRNVADELRSGSAARVIVTSTGLKGE